MANIKQTIRNKVAEVKNLPRDQLLGQFENAMKKRQVEWSARGSPITEAEFEAGLKVEWEGPARHIYGAAGITFDELLERGKKAIADTSGAFDLPKNVQRIADMVGRNTPCPCGSGRKYKKCCGKGG